MTIKITKQLATMEDLAIGTGAVVQERNGVPLTLTKIDLITASMLASENAGEGASLVSMEGGPTVESAVTTNSNDILDRVIRVTSIAAMEAYSAPVGYVFSLNAGSRSGVFDVVAGLAPFSDSEKGVYIPLSNGNHAKRRYNGEIKIEWFGALGDGTTNNSVAISAAFNFAQIISGGIVGAGVGVFYCTSSIAIDIDFDSGLYGTSRGNTQFLFSGNNGFAFTASEQSLKFDIRDFEVVAQTGNTLAAIDFTWPEQAGLVQSQVQIKSIDIYGFGNTGYFETGIKLNNCSNVNIDGCLINGQGGNQTTTVGSGIFIDNSFDVIITNSRFHFWNKAIHLYDYAEGVNISGIKIEYSDFGIFKERVGAIGVTEGLQLNVTDSHLTCRRRGIVVNEHKSYFLSNIHIQARDDAATPIEPGSSFGLIDFIGIEVQGAQTTPSTEVDASVIENISFRATTNNNTKSVLYGIVVRDAKDLIVTDCPQISNVNIGIWLQSGSVNVIVKNIVNRDCTDDFLDEGTDNIVMLRDHTKSVVLSLSGGAASETVDVAIGSGIFNTKPTFASLQFYALGNKPLIAAYSFDSASSTKTNLRFVLYSLDSTNIGATSERFGLYAIEGN